MSPYIAPGVSVDERRICANISSKDRVEHIIEAAHGFTFDMLRVKHRKPELVRARSHAIYLLYERTDMTYASIAMIFYPAITDHTSAIYQITKMDKALDLHKKVKHVYALVNWDKCVELASILPKVRVKHNGKWVESSQTIKQ